MASAAVYAPVVLLVWPLPLLWRYRVITRWAAFQVWLLKISCGIYHRVEGKENLPKGPAIILSKHQSAWETLAFQQIFPPFTWVLKRELMWIPLFGWALASLRPIAIDRRSSRKAVEQVIAQGRERLQSGIWVLVFPEGTRMVPRARRRYGIGGAVLANATGYPVVPVAHNAGSLWARRSIIKRPGLIRVVIGPVIQSQGRSVEEINHAAKTWIENTMKELE